MTDRELSERLATLADRLEEIADSDSPNWFTLLPPVARELRSLSNEKYTPGHTSWDDLKKQIETNRQSPNQTIKRGYRDKQGRPTPF